MSTVRRWWLLPVFFLALLLLLLPPAARAGAPPVFELVESWPAETSLAQPGLRETHVVWQEMIDGARESLDFAEFYAASVPGSRLEPIIDAIARAAARGVRVRFLTEKAFYDKDPSIVDRLGALPGVALRILSHFSARGGVMHCKYFLVDGREAFLGSQNFDWRSLTHNQELGLRTTLPGLVATLRAVFEGDWRLAGGEAATFSPPSPPAHGVERLSLPDGDILVQPALSPMGALPDERSWDLPGLLDLIGGARERVRLQLLNYATRDYGGGELRSLDRALRRAAARGVTVELLLADWAVAGKALEDLRGLQRSPNLSVRLVSIPEASTGFIPFARVIHSKFLVVDGQLAWLGTSNWKPGYFSHSRNVGVIVQGEAFARQLDRIFEATWTSPYAVALDPEAELRPPRIQ